MFEIDYSKAQEFANIENGTYETTIKKAAANATPGGADFLDIQFKIREDFDQKFKKNLIFHRIFAKKADGKYPVGSLMNLAKAAGIPDGTKFSSLDDYLDQLVGKAVKVTVKNEKSEYNGKTYDNLNVKKLEKSELPAIATESAPAFDESKLPF